MLDQMNYLTQLQEVNEIINETAPEDLWGHKQELVLNHYLGVQFSSTLYHLENNYEAWLLQIKTCLESFVFNYARRDDVRDARECKAAHILAPWSKLRDKIAPDDKGNFRMLQGIDREAVKQLAQQCRDFRKDFLQTRTRQEKQHLREAARLQRLELANVKVDGIQIAWVPNNKETHESNPDQPGVPQPGRRHPK